MHIFARMTKVDEATRTVTGVIANEALDRSGEMFDYLSSKPHFEQWSGDIAKATGGKSVGNVRAMHGNVAAGILKALNMDDDSKAISVDAHIVDDNEWKKVQTGTYTGFSIGGSYARKWKGDDGVQRYEAKPCEVSLVDLPCNPDAQFAVIKLDGETEMRKFETPAVEIEQFAVVDMEVVELEKSADPVADPVAVVDVADPLEKMGAKHSAKTKGHLAAMAEHHKAMGDHMAAMQGQDADADDAGKSADGDLHKGADDLAKLHTEHAEALAKIAGERDDLAKKLEAVTAEHAELLTKAAPAKGAARVVGKDDENGTELAKRDDSPVLNKDGSTDYQATALKMMKFVHGR